MKNTLKTFSLLSLTVFAFICAALSAKVVAAPTGSAKAKKTEKAAAGKPKDLGGGLIAVDNTVGKGAEAKTGKMVKVHYTGWLFDPQSKQKGNKFDSSVDRKQPFEFPLGTGMVIKGWDEGVAGMKVGGKRTLTIPPEKGYGAQGAGGAIPPNATLLFDVELLDVKG